MTTPEILEKLRSKHPKRLGRSKAVKLYCKENCCAGDNISWADCTQKGCFLWSYRKGREILATAGSFDKKTSKLAVLRKKELAGKIHQSSLETKESESLPNIISP